MISVKLQGRNWYFLFCWQHAAMWSQLSLKLVHITIFSLHARSQNLLPNCLSAYHSYLPHIKIGQTHLQTSMLSGPVCNTQKLPLKPIRLISNKLTPTPKPQCCIRVSYGTYTTNRNTWLLPLHWVVTTRPEVAQIWPTCVCSCIVLVIVG